MRLTSKYPVYSPDNLPNMKHHSFVMNGKTGYVGSIFKRLSDNGGGLTYHYGIFYGIDQNNIVYLLHNDLYGIECLSLDDWLGDEYDDFDVDLNIRPELKDIILKRVQERKRVPFNLRKNNCEHFMNYCIYGEVSSYQAKMFTAISNVLFFVFGLDISLSGNDQLKKEYRDFKKNILRPKALTTKRLILKRESEKKQSHETGAGQNRQQYL